MAAHWLSLPIGRWLGPTVYLAVGFNGLQVLFFTLLAAVAWKGYRQRGDPCLPWLGGYGLARALPAAFAMAPLAGPVLVQGIGFRLLYPVLLTLPLIAAAGLLLSGRRPNG